MISSPATQEALHALEQGRIALADLSAQVALASNPRDAAAWNVLGQIARSRDVDAPDLAVQFFKHAISADPACQAAVINLDAALRESAAKPPRSEDTRGILLIREWGAGFWSEVDNVLGGLLLAQMSRRTPSVWWGEHCLFGDSTGNAWERYFEPVSSVPIPEAAARRPVFPSKWETSDALGAIASRWNGPGSRTPRPHYLRRDEPLVVTDFFSSVVSLQPWLDPASPYAGLPANEIYRRLMSTFIRPRPGILEQVESFCSEQLQGRPTIAMHLRGSDKAIEVQGYQVLLNQITQTAGHHLDARPDAALFLLTDFEPFLIAAQSYFGSRVIASKSARSRTQRGIHFQSGYDPFRIGEEVLIDTLVAARCDVFVGAGVSNVSCMVRHLKDWAPGTCLLLGPNLQDIRNTFIYHVAMTDQHPTKLPG